MATFLPIDHHELSDDDVWDLMRRFNALDGQPRDEIDYQVWRAAATSGNWQRAELVAGLVDLMRTFTGFRIMPAHLTEAVLRCRAQVAAWWNPPDPPRELADDPQREIRWRRGALADFRARAMLHLAQGGSLSDVPMISKRFEGAPELPAADPDSPAALAGREAVAEATRRWNAQRGYSHAAAIAAHASRTASLRTVDPDGMRTARAELEARRPGELPAELIEHERAAADGG